MNEPILKIEHLTKSFGYKRAVSDISLEVQAGEICGILGPNGSGKTTTIKMIVGLLHPDDGEIFICGKNVNKNFEEALENVGAIVENPDMHKDISGRVNLELAARVRHGITKERIEEVIKLVKLENRIDEKVKRYSLGMKQRLGIAMALLSKPKLLIFDEPTNGLDPEGIKEFRETVKRAAHEEGAGVFVSSHMMSEMQELCDRVVIIEKGRIVDEKDVKAIAAGSESKMFKFVVSDAEKASEIIKGILGDSGIESVETHKMGELDVFDITCGVLADEIPTIVKALTENGIGMYGVQPVGVSLEETYLKATTGGKIN